MPGISMFGSEIKLQFRAICRQTRIPPESWGYSLYADRSDKEGHRVALGQDIAPSSVVAGTYETRSDARCTGDATASMRWWRSLDPITFFQGIVQVHVGILH